MRSGGNYRKNNEFDAQRAFDCFRVFWRVFGCFSDVFSFLGIFSCFWLIPSHCKPFSPIQPTVPCRQRCLVPRQRLSLRIQRIHRPRNHRPQFNVRLNRWRNRSDHFRKQVHRSGRPQSLRRLPRMHCL